MTDQPEFADFHYAAPDGLKLHARIYGAGHRGKSMPIVCLPGLTRNARDFHELALALAGDERNPRMVVAFDYRGRGQSAWDRDWRRYDILVEAADISTGLTALDVHRAGFIGTSRGGLILHVLAAARPGALHAVVLNDVGPAVEGDGVAQIRTYLERMPKPKDWAEAVTILKMVHGEAFPALGDEDWERSARAIYVKKNGRLVADFDPRILKTVKNIDLSKPLPQLWPQFMGLTAMPLLAIRGENSKLLSDETLEKMNALHPRMKMFTVRGQGHAPFLETGDLPARIGRFFAGVN